MFAPLVLVAAALAPAPAQAAPGGSAAVPPRLAPSAPLSPADGEVIVRFRADAAAVRMHALAAARPADGPANVPAIRAALEGRAAALGARVGHALAGGDALGERVQVVRARGADAAALARRIAADPDVEWAVPNGRQRRLTAPNDPLYLGGPPVSTLTRTGGPAVGQWYLRAPDATLRSALDVEPAWARTTGASSVVVAVLDTGVRFEHPDLGPRLLAGYDFVNNPTVANDGDGRDGDPSDPGDWITSADAATPTFRECEVSGSSWHGTATASLVGASTGNAVGMAGAGPGLRVLPVRVLGKCFGNDSDIIAGMRWAAGIAVPGVPLNPNPARVINMSLGSSDACSAAYQQAVDEITARGVMIVAAAGNSAGGPVGTPASCRGVVAVAALRHAGTKVGFSDLGPEIAIAAPGGNCVNVGAGEPCLYPILSATNSGAQGPTGSGWSDAFDITVGTSFSSPLVAGIAGLMWSRLPALTVDEVRSILRSTARPFPQSGADTGAGEPPVVQCVPPRTGVTQLQCYCTTALCGAGMVDAGAALAAVAARSDAAFVSMTHDPVRPGAGATLTLSVTGAQAATGRTVASFTWLLVDGGGIAGSLAASGDGRLATVTPSGTGTLRVRLTMTDDLGVETSVDESIAVGPVDAAPAPAADGGGGGGGGGATSPVWLALLALAVAALHRDARRRRRA